MQVSLVPAVKEQGAAPWQDENRRLTFLIVQAKGGDADAFEELYRRTARWLLSQVRRYVDDGQAEDVLAEVYLQVWRSLHSFDESRAPPAVWLAVIARSRALDHLRREKVHGSPRNGAAATEADEIEAGGDGPEQLLARTQQYRLLHLSLAVAPLSPEERLLLGLAYFRDSTQQEISLLTGLPLGTVKTVLRRAQHKLRLQLAPPAGPPQDFQRLSIQPTP